MKRFVIFVLTALLLFALVSCAPEASLPSETPSLPPAEVTISPPPAVTPSPEPTPTPVVLDAAARMRSLTPEDIKYIDSFRDVEVEPQVLTKALNGAADHTAKLTTVLSPYNVALYDVTIYLAGGPDGYSFMDEHFILTAGLEEELVWIRYKGLKGSEELYVVDSALYWAVRNIYHTETNIDAEAFSWYRPALEARAQQTVDSTMAMGNEKLIFSGYDIVEFIHEDTFETADATYTLYHWSVAFTTSDPEHVGWCGGMYMDASVRVCSVEQETYFVVKITPDGEREYRFLYWDLYFGETEAERRENALARIEQKFETTAEPSPPLTPEPTPTPTPVVLDAAARMGSITPEDFEYISSFHDVDPQTLADALNSAADHMEDLINPIDFNMPAYSMTVYLSRDSKNLLSDQAENFNLMAGLTEDVVQILYRSSTGHMERLHVRDSTLYWVLRNSYRTEVKIDAEAFARYQTVLEKRAQDRMVNTNVALLEEVLTSYDIVKFIYADTIETDDAIYTIYEGNVAFTSFCNDFAGWAGGMYMDAEGRVCGMEQYTYFVVKTTPSGEEDCRFLFWNLYFGETEAERRAYALEFIEREFAAEQ